MAFGRWKRLGAVLIAAAAATAGQSSPAAQPAELDIRFFAGMTWRNVGPFRGGTTTAASGVPGQPNVFYAGTANGGLWKTTDAGRVWRPIFDSEGSPSVGSIAVAPDGRTIYVGTGALPEAQMPAPGDGLYRSVDAGQSWTRLGFGEARHISAVEIDPRVPERVFVAVMASSVGPDDQGGVYRSADTGRSFQRVLAAGSGAGALDLAVDPASPAIVYATLVSSGAGSRGGPSPVPGVGMFKSTDAGTTWRASGNGLPTFADHGVHAVRIAVAPTDGSRLFAAVQARNRGGLYRSDDAGANWTLVNESTGRDVSVDPSNADVAYLIGTDVLRSADAGRALTVWQPGIGGRGYAHLWINPTMPSAAILVGDRGARITVNGGETWSSTENQPTGEFADVATDNAFPYRICGAQVGSVPGCLPSRGLRGRIAASDWQPVGNTANGVVAPDPQDPDIVYGGTVGRFDRRTGQVHDVRPPLEQRGQTWLPAPLLFAPDNRTLYFGTHLLWRTNGPLQGWTAISPDLSRQAAERGPSSVSANDLLPMRRGAISAVAPSPIDPRLTWAGTSDGLVHVTRDAGVGWTDVSPRQLPAWARVSAIEASHFDTSTAYVAADARELGDDSPRLWRTRDGGATWIPITGGLPPGAVVHAIGEDSFRRGLLFAATGRSVFVSFDDGNRWQALRLNLPPVPVTDLDLKDADLVIATYGRGFWVLDDISALRQATADVTRADLFLFRPPTAWRTHAVADRDGAATRDEPTAVGPAEGVSIAYLVGSAAGPVAIEIVETLTGEVIRRFSNIAAEEAGSATEIPATQLNSSPGFHRATWDLKYAPIAGRSVWVMPGTYQVRLTAGSRVARQAVVVRMDPRIRTSTADLTAQFKISKAVYDRRRLVSAALARLRKQPPPAPEAVSGLESAALDLDEALDALQQSDVRPTAATEAAAAAAIERAVAAIDRAQGG
jgi:photosystem II stability/assembly factor-like uncharacterized protein